jgi:hypothetical protein
MRRLSQDGRFVKWPELFDKGHSLERLEKECEKTTVCLGIAQVGRSPAVKDRKTGVYAT